MTKARQPLPSRQDLAEALRRRGFDPESPMAALLNLAEAPSLELPLLMELVAELEARREAGLGEVLQRILDRGLPKENRRELRRTLFRLEQAKLWSPPVAAPPTTKALLGEPEEPPQAWASPIGPGGDRVLWIARRHRGVVVSASAVISDLAGVLELHAGETSRKALMSGMREMAQRSGLRFTEMPWPYGVHLLQQALDRSEKPERFDQWPRVRARLVPNEPSLAPTRPAPPIARFINLATLEVDDKILAESGSLLELAELHAWLLPVRWLAGAIEQIGQANESVLVVTPAQRAERARAAAEEASAAILDVPERRELFAERLEDAAFLLWTRGERDAALRSCQVAAAARRGTPIQQIPLLWNLAKRSLAMVLATQRQRAQQAREEAPSSLILTPAQALAEQRSVRKPPR